MTPEQLARVRFLVRADAWAEWEKLGQPPDTLDMALTEYGDLRLVAAYVLETVCSKARELASETLAQTKRIKVGPIEIEKATNTANRLTTQADDWCSRATKLQGGVAYERNIARRPSTRTVALPVEVTF